MNYSTKHKTHVSGRAPFSKGKLQAADYGSRSHARTSARRHAHRGSARLASHSLRHVETEFAWESRGEGDKTIIILPWFGVERSFAAAAFEPAVEKAQLRRIYVDLPGCGHSPPGPTTSDGIVDEILLLVRRVPRSGPRPATARSIRRTVPRLHGLPNPSRGPRAASDGDRLSTLAAERLSRVPRSPRGRPRNPLGGSGTRHRHSSAESPAGRRLLPRAAQRAGLSAQRRGHAVRIRATSRARPGTPRPHRRLREPIRALDAYPAATFTLLDHAGHYLPFERPKPFKASVREWLARISIHEPTPEQR
jgi:pimeloyl-ACP methyl ester carboxylesterase